MSKTKKILNKYQYNNLFYKYPDIELFDERQWSSIMQRYSLTMRENEVARMTIKGSSYNKIAKNLKVESSTIKVHLRNIYRKTQANNKMVLILTFIDYINRAYNKND